ncbi:PREDICTED: mediator of RNA polymerase II transcription subunit 1 [Vollenhovia emeryi]|uniref:mediator of RNA polymerase II transcription subunit 1 n=1 Tax=Vollenhovia emeryi TaxID=411798 RepID=UPI0005F55AAD|nr:PREDICTED: mediator of RNA polymerase II transcription subunit 1 [Vollenhovia emeryi]
MDATNGQKPHVGQPSTGGVSTSDKGKEWQMELLMEKLRSKASTFKPLVETAKNMRMAMLDKRFAIDSIEKNQLQKCLDTLQHSIKVTSFQSMVERLESLARQLGLKFMMSGPPGTEIFISSDMFFLEVLLEPSGLVRDVKIHHEGKSEQQSCEALASVLSRGDFVDFTTQLEGLASIYQLNADKKVKCKAFSALQSLEADLGILAQLQTFMKEPFNLVHKSPVGILERRKGGHPMKLTYFVSPYDLIDEENRTYDTLNPETIVKRKIGHSVTVCMEGSTGHKLPTSSIITVNRSPTGKSTPSYAPLTSTNSSMLPACFVLKLGKKMPICMELVKRIQKVTELECGDISAPHPLLSLIIQHASDGQLDCRSNKGLYVTLPDQQHCYFMTENKNMEGVLVCSIPFTHPAHVPPILVYLRQQALFNCLIASCVRPMARQDPEHTTILEVSALSWQHISVSVEHPYEESMATAELDLTDISTLKCRLYGVSMTNAEQTSDLSGRVLQRCLSIPLTMRMLLKIWEGRSLPAVMNNLTSGSGSSNGSYNLNLGSGGKDQTGQNASGTASGMPDFTNGETKVKQEPGLNNGSNGCMGGRQAQQQQQSSSSQLQQQQQQQQQQQSFLDAGTENSIGFPSYSGQSDTTTVTMGTAGTNNASASMLNPLQLGALLGQAKNSLAGNSSTNERGKKTRKRKAGTDGLWRSPKRKNDGGDSSTATEILLESSSSENSTPLGTPTGGRENLASETRTSTPTSATSLTSGIDFSNLDATDVPDKSATDYDLDNSERDSEIMEVQAHSGPEQQQQPQQQQPQQDIEELIKIRESSSSRKSKKNRSGGGGGGSGSSEEKKSSPTNIFVDETSTTSSGNKGLPVPPSVSITPISCGNLDQTSTTNYNSVLTGMGLERRPGIEIIPIASSPSQTSLPSSITITPIAGPTSSSKTSGLTSATEDRQRSERKSGGGKSSGSSSKSSSEDNKSGGTKIEKRRKRKREDSPMGPPPDKVPSGGKQQQDPLSKPVSVSIKPSTEQSPPSGGSTGVGLSCSSSRPTSPAAVRKFSPSPTSSLATLVGKSSPTLKVSQTAAATCGKPVQSPKHSPVYGSSPKHNASNVPVVPMSVPMSLTVSTVPNTVGSMPSVAVSVPVPVPASASPKHGSTSSPKHGSSAASSGKPSMSALKSAANSPSGKSSGSSSSDTTATSSKVKSSSSSSSKDSSSRGDKERRTSSIGSSGGSGGGHQSPKTKSSSGKLKQLELISPGGGATQVSSLQASGGSTPPSGQVDAASKSAIAAQQARNRKSSLNAVIDKLKNAQHCTETDTCGNGGGTVKSSGSSGLGGNTGGISSTGQKEKSIGSSGSSSSSGGKTIVEGGKSSCVTKNASVETKNPAEYMVKHSSDGIKITINKTRTKDSKQSAANLKLTSSGTMATATSSSSSLSSVASSSSSSSSSGNVIAGSNGSPKTHTGLKPGVNSGPASKKPQTLQTSQKLLPTKMMLAAAGIKSAISSSGATSTGGSAGIASATGGIGGNPLSKGSSSKASGSPKTSSGVTDLSRGRDKPRIPKSGDKGIFASKSLGDARKSSPSALREESESERAFKLLAAHASISSLPPSLPPQLVMEGLMKQLDTKFQIPKLSARANVADTTDKNKSDKLSILSDSTKQTLDGLKQEQGKIAGLSNVSMSVSKSSLSDDQSRRDHSQNKPDNLSISTSVAGAMSLNLVGENAGLMLPPQSAADSDVPTNLCIQPMVDNEPSRDSCKDLGMRQTSGSQQFLGKIDDTSAGGILSKGNVPDQLASSGAKSYATMTGSSASTAPSGAAIVAESLNLSTKPADQAALQTKYNKITEEKKQQILSTSSSSSSSTSSSSTSSSSSSSSIFSSLGSAATTSDGNPSVVMTSDSVGGSAGGTGSGSGNGSGSGSGSGGEQEVAAAAAAAAAEMLLDFSTANKDPITKGSHGLPTSLAQHHLTTIPERAMTQAAPTVRRNTPPPPPPPPPLPAPFPPAASPSVSVHIVKSPAPSPRVIPPSPHSSASPCITDDELMDEALVGMGK